MSKRRVVITGLGIISPVGIGIPTVWQNIVAGKSGISKITHFDASAMASQIAGEVKDFDVTQFLSAKDARRMDKFIHFGLVAGIEAFKDSGLEVTEQNAERIGVNIGSGIGGLPMIEDTHNDYLASGPRKISPPTINIFEQDPECDLDYCANTARDMKIDVAVNNNFGFGGTNGSLVFRKV